MPVFISYSHQDKGFVDKLVIQLVQYKTYVWLDRWELKVGDSIIEKVQSAIKDASALIVVLSKASVSSEWCRKEINAGLIRELDERRIVVMPLLLEDCEIPMFLKDKKFADFRTDFDKGLQDTLTAIAGVTSNTQGRIENPEFHIDWGIGWGYTNSLYALDVKFVDHSEKIPYCALTEVHIICSKALTQKFKEYEQQGIDWFGRLIIVTALYQTVCSEVEPTFVLHDSLTKTKEIHIVDSQTGFDLDCYILSRRLGVDTGMGIVLDWGTHIKHLLEDLSRDVSESDREKLRQAFRVGGS